MAPRYPEVEPYESGMLPVGNGHELYWESVGRPDGVPALLLHGGPGQGCTAGMRRSFDPDAYRTVLFDQRGCGRSRPLASDPGADLSTNTTAHLVDDIERLRVHLGIDRWVVVGRSWGVTLALVYAQAHPDRVRAMVLAGVTAGTRREIEWITWEMGRVFPREWEQFLAVVPADERSGDLAAAYARLLASRDPHARARAAASWCAWEDTHVSLAPGWSPGLADTDPGFAGVFARLERIPAVLIHGRYDVSSPLETAWRLHRAWAGSRLVVVDDAGHGGGSLGTETIAAIDSFQTAP